VALMDASPNVTVTPSGPSQADISGVDVEHIGELAAEHRIVLYELTPQRASLEEAFMELTHDDVEYHAGTTASTNKPAEVIS